MNSSRIALWVVLGSLLLFVSCSDGGHTEITYEYPVDPATVQPLATPDGFEGYAQRASPPARAPSDEAEAFVRLLPAQAPPAPAEAQSGAPGAAAQDPPAAEAAGQHDDVEAVASVTLIDPRIAWPVDEPGAPPDAQSGAVVVLIDPDFSGLTEAELLQGEPPADALDQQIVLDGDSPREGPVVLVRLDDQALADELLGEMSAPMPQTAPSAPGAAGVPVAQQPAPAQVTAQPAATQYVQPAPVTSAATSAGTTVVFLEPVRYVQSTVVFYSPPVSYHYVFRPAHLWGPAYCRYTCCPIWASPYWTVGTRLWPRSYYAAYTDTVWIDDFYLGLPPSGWWYCRPGWDPYRVAGTHVMYWPAYTSGAYLSVGYSSSSWGSSWSVGFSWRSGCPSYAWPHHPAVRHGGSHWRPPHPPPMTTWTRRGTQPVYVRNYVGRLRSEPVIGRIVQSQYDREQRYSGDPRALMGTVTAADLDRAGRSASATVNPPLLFGRPTRAPSVTTPAATPFQKPPPALPSRRVPARPLTAEQAHQELLNRTDRRATESAARPTPLMGRAMPAIVAPAPTAVSRPSQPPALTVPSRPQTPAPVVKDLLTSRREQLEAPRQPIAAPSAPAPRPDPQPVVAPRPAVSFPSSRQPAAPSTPPSPDAREALLRRLEELRARTGAASSRSPSRSAIPYPSAPSPVAPRSVSPAPVAPRPPTPVPVEPRMPSPRAIPSAPPVRTLTPPRPDPVARPAQTPTPPPVLRKETGSGVILYTPGRDRPSPSPAPASPPAVRPAAPAPAVRPAPTAIPSSRLPAPAVRPAPTAIPSSRLPVPVAPPASLRSRTSPPVALPRPAPPTLPTPSRRVPTVVPPQATDRNQPSVRDFRSMRSRLPVTPSGESASTPGK